MAMLLRQKNRELIEKQDYEIRLATLNERGRIAREIHDHVGHLLSRSILQIGALMVTKGREQRIIKLVAEGLSNREIAEALCLGEGTVRNYLSIILEKLELSDRTQLAVFYLKRA